MVPKKLCTALVAATLLAWIGGSVADDYRPGELLSLDLSTAVLSPKPLGPAQNFAPVPVEARADRPNRAAQARAAPKAEPRTEAKFETKIETKAVAPRTGVAQARAEKPRGAARTRLARRPNDRTREHVAVADPSAHRPRHRAGHLLPRRSPGAYLCREGSRRHLPRPIGCIAATLGEEARRRLRQHGAASRILWRPEATCGVGRQARQRGE